VKKRGAVTASLFVFHFGHMSLNTEGFCDDNQQNEQYQDCTRACEWVVANTSYVATTAITYFAHVIASSSSGIP